MTTLFHIGPKGFNVGNHAISLGLRSLVGEAFGRVVNWISIPATSRYETHQRAGLTARTVHEINQFGDGVIVGGGNLYENGELTVDPNALAALEVPLLLFSLSWGRIYNRRLDLVPRTDAMRPDLIRALNDAATISLARDRATHAHLRSLGIDKVELGGCPTILLDQFAGNLPEVPEADRAGAFISVRTPDLMNVPLSEQRRTTEDLYRLIAWFRDLGHEPRLLCHDHRDVPYAASIGGVDFVYTENVGQYLALLRASSLNVSYRLHSALPLLSFGRPVIKVSYDERSLSLMETLGFGDWNIDVVRAKDTLADVEDRYARLDSFQEVLDAARPTIDGLSAVMRDAMSRFAGAVTAYDDHVTGDRR